MGTNNSINIKSIMLCIVLCITVGVVCAQSYPVVGKPMPQFSLDNVHYYNTDVFSNRDLQGKWTIMDFWSKSCSGCVRNFPKVNKLQHEFKEQVFFLLVGKMDHTNNSNTASIYERYRKNMDLQLAIAYDSAIFDQFGIQGVPLIIVINPKGVVYAVTKADFLTTDNIRLLVSGENPAFTRSYSKYEVVPSSVKRQPWKYLLKQGEQQGNIIFRSLLSENYGEPAAGYFNIDKNVAQGMFQIVRISLSQLYNIAYLGTTNWNRYMSVYIEYWPFPVLELSDSVPFQVNYQNYTGLYNYSLIIPVEKSSKYNLMCTMQDDLKRYFGYEVAVETRLMPYWRLTATDQARKKLLSKSQVTKVERDPTGMTAKHITVELVLSQIEEYNMGKGQPSPFINETNIYQPIDIVYSAVLTDLNDVAKELKKQGLILEKTKKEFKVLVIRDGNTNKAFK